MNKKDKLYESDLYEPIRKYFSKLGYAVYGEVKNCDVTAIKEDELIIIELKKNLTVDLLVQAANRKRMTELVYIAIPKPKYNLRSKKWRDICHLIRRLEIGLILISLQKTRTNVEIALSPAPFDSLKTLKLNKKKREQIIREVEGRNGDYNVGGSNKTKIMTAYKESCIQIAFLLGKLGELSPKELRSMGTGDKTASILNKNYYGWFSKVRHGVYTLNEKGKQDIQNFQEQVDFFAKIHDGTNENQGK